MILSAIGIAALIFAVIWLSLNRFQAKNDLPADIALLIVVIVFIVQGILLSI